IDRLADSPTPDFGAPMVSSVNDTADIPKADQGREQNVVFADGAKVPVRYAVVEADSMVASNDIDGNPNKAYYGRKKAGMLYALNNGRTAGLQAAYARGNAADYKQGLLGRADQLGIDKAAIEGKRQPVLVRLY